MRRFFSTTLGQILAIVAAASALTLLLFIGLLFYLGGPHNPPWPWNAAYRITIMVELLGKVPEGRREEVIDAAQWSDLSARLTEAPALCATQTLDTRDLEALLRHELPGVTDATARACDSDGAEGKIQVLVPMGNQTLDIQTDKVGYTPPRITFPFVSALLFTCIGVASMSAWAVWTVIRPLRRLSEKAEAFGREIVLAPLEEEGPLEIKRAARAFNLMQERITRSIYDRTRTLAAISHDLRTPLTRMRLQLDTNSTDIARAKLLSDINLMQSMVTSALAFLSGSFDNEEREWLDLDALLITLCDEYEETGATITYRGLEQIRLFCQPNAITRALTNLIENAIHFGETVLVTASTQAAAITIDIADDGPGIPKDRVQDVVEPFVRLDRARSRRSGSVGLGLSIVKEIVEAHSGTLALIERQPSGLVARITFPILDPAIGLDEVTASRPGT
ncbi:HAMP domain-containing protein [Agrobacterium vitis]|uniref:histidine kinase n=1 Tax=Agrobacterium vitis TaxID=373 RepID=A0A6L6VJZ1_AGRVI|nr:ATP-binding protein [Agrobacterium vitis]MUZ75391.1 HAMP domain-containing protein [Agrobacterium vitis]